VSSPLGTRPRPVSVSIDTRWLVAQKPGPFRPAPRASARPTRPGVAIRTAPARWFRPARRWSRTAATFATRTSAPARRNSTSELVLRAGDPSGPAPARRIPMLARLGEAEARGIHRHRSCAIPRAGRRRVSERDARRRLLRRGRAGGQRCRETRLLELHISSCVKESGAIPTAPARVRPARACYSNPRARVGFDSRGDGPGLGQHLSPAPARPR
jgi:hypothetical protein